MSKVYPLETLELLLSYYEDEEKYDELLANNPLMHIYKKGICGLTLFLNKYKNIISDKEYVDVMEFLANNLPDGTISYNWEPFLKEPRIKWLKEQIEFIKNI